MSAIVDVTDRLRAEAQLRQAQKMEAVGQLTGGVAHDFNNLLTAVMGNLELICRAAPGHERVQRLAAAALKAAGRGARLTASLLAFSRRQALQTEALDANALLREFDTLLRRAAGETVRLELRLDPALTFCQADAAQLEAAVLNLAINARDAMPAGGTLVVATANAELGAAELRGNSDAQPGRFVAVSLRDSGSGMAPEVLARAFEPFFTTKEQGKGTGLGLSQVFGFARQSGGHVAIRSAPGQGTTVTLFLPQAAAEAEAGGADARLDGVVAVAAATVLLVEDDPDVREVTRATLRDAGLRVIAAHDAAEALRLLEAGEAIDLLFTDVVMPGGIGGVELARRTRALRPGVAILLASGYATAALRAHGVEPGEFAVLGKPYRLAELTARIRAALDGEASVVAAGN